MNDLTRCPEPDALTTLLYEDEGDSAEYAALQAHVQRCAACADALAALHKTRGALSAWTTPRQPLGFAVVQTHPPLWKRVVPWAGLAAAAVLTLAGAAGLAGLDVRYDDNGFALRTGWARASETAAVQPVTRESAVRPAGILQTDSGADDPRTGWVSRAGEGEPPWRSDFDLLATQLRADFDTMTRAAEQRLADAATPRVSSVAASTVLDEDRLMQRIAERIDQSEVRQQQNLALRIAELGREFQLRRQADLVQFERGLARIENQRQDLIRRVAVSQPQP